MLRKSLSAFIVVCMLFALSASAGLAQDDPLRVVYVVNGVLGDKSFFDSGQRGVEMAMDEYDIDVKTI